MRQLIDQSFGESVGKIAERAVGTQILEVEHRDATQIDARCGAASVSTWCERDRQGRGPDQERDADRHGNRTAPRLPRLGPPCRGDPRDLAGARVGECFGEFSRCLIPIGGHFFERALDHDFEFVRNRVAHDLEPRHRVERVPRHDRLRGRAGERRLARERLVQHARETVDVAAAIHLSRARGLLGRHVRGCPDGESGLRQLVAARGADGARDAEVGDDRVTARQHDVLRLDVAMDDVVFVRVRERFGHFAGDLECIVDGQLRLTVQPVAEGFAFDVRHHVVQHPARVAGIVDREDVGMLEAGGELDLAQEPLAAEGHRDLGAQRLQRDESLVSRVARQVDQRHPATAQLPIDHVVLGQRGVQLCKRISHADNDSSGSPARRAPARGWRAASAMPGRWR